MTSREGKLTVEGDRAALNFERRLPYSVDAVWAAITDPAQRNQWMGQTTIDAREGGSIEMVPHSPPIPPQQKKMTGRIRVWDPPRVFEHEWNQPVLSAPEAGVVRYELIPDGDGTLLRFTHRGLTISDGQGFHPGTHAYLDRLEAHLGGQPLPDWARRYQEVAQTLGTQWTPREGNKDATQRN
ncbi:SRPBCC family protein [Mycolicibacterium porcinum]|uniref:SRPBCC family protein n=1 Tax=Mycolicibacterium porcinum TaxID=39693 RepID=UPI001190A162|nr:SRPBCC family protein [Mycolicibacterium porcinum]TVY01670.1 SRPBCC family protein [Mycolicibacterium porcinum]